MRVIHEVRSLGGEIGDGDARVESATRGRRAWAVLRTDPLFWVGATLVSIAIAVALFAPILAPYDPLHQFRRDGLSPTGDPLGPSAKFLLGTDRSGRDYLSRLIFGARTSIAIALIANTVATVLGVIVGAVAAYARSPMIRIRGTPIRFGLPVEAALMRITDLALAFPVLLLAIALAAVLGPSIGLVILVITSVTWATTSRIVYGRVSVLRDADFVDAAEASGVGSARILVRHILPHVFPLAIVYAALGIAATILFETTLSFLGAGVPAPAPTWGTMIADHISWYATDPRLVVLPGVAIMLTVLGFSLLGDSLRDALDPRTASGRLA
jgi:peptide/nickel transport system permease protein